MYCWNMEGILSKGETTLKKALKIFVCARQGREKHSVKKNAKLVHKLQTCHVDDVRSGVIGCYAAFRSGIGSETQVCMQFAVSKCLLCCIGHMLVLKPAI